ncbi:MAG: hypothetical protein NTZ92_00570 [Candidatus Omnitrophica bacterium]|nr:hypothetical protein [Candidatus Omnitrophota bacterium]
MKTILELARCKGSVIKEVEEAPYDHHTQRRELDLTRPGLKHALKSSTMFDGEGSQEADA